MGRKNYFNVIKDLHVKSTANTLKKNLKTFALKSKTI